MPYFQLRITLSEQRTKHVCLRAVRWLIREYKLDLYSCGYEELNKYGEPCDPHIHFNFLTHIERVNPKRCIQDKLRRHFETLDISLKGNKQWSLQMVEEPKDFDRWFRYPLKENPSMQLTTPFLTEDEAVNGLYGQEHIEYLCKLALEERKLQIEKNILHREKLRNKDLFKQKMYDFIAQHDNKVDDIKPHIWKLIFTFYKQESKPINFTIIEGYTNLWLADNDHMSASDAFELAHKFSN